MKFHLSVLFALCCNGLLAQQEIKLSLIGFETYQDTLTWVQSPHTSYSGNRVIDDTLEIFIPNDELWIITESSINLWFSSWEWDFYSGSSTGYPPNTSNIDGRVLVSPLLMKSDSNGPLGANGEDAVNQISFENFNRYKLLPGMHKVIHEFGGNGSNYATPFNLSFYLLIEKYKITN